MYVEQGRPDQTGESYDSRNDCCSTSNSSVQQYERAVSTVRNRTTLFLAMFAVSVATVTVLARYSCSSVCCFFRRMF